MVSEAILESLSCILFALFDAVEEEVFQFGLLGEVKRLYIPQPPILLLHLLKPPVQVDCPIMLQLCKCLEQVDNRLFDAA